LRTIDLASGSSGGRGSSGNGKDALAPWLSFTIGLNGIGSGSYDS